MTDAVAPRDVDSTDWWEHRPVFSVADKGSRITGLAPGRAPGRITPRLLVSALLTFVAWAAVTLLGSVSLCSATSAGCAVGVAPGWLIGGLLVLGYLALLLAVGLGEDARDRFGQRRAAWLYCRAPLLAGVVAGAGAGAAVAVGPDRAEGVRQALDGVPGTEAALISAVVAALAALWGLTVVARLPSALRHARERQQRIERLRRDGHRYAGRLRLGDVRVWLHNDPELDVTVSYDSPAGRHEVRARMRSSPDRVPKDGSSVVVLTDLQSAVHLELDHDARPEFEPEQRYTPSE
ncbi:hypothetical protein [Jiangella alba]|uniref:Uncharacterized protein n=1 Tax=Jiangella alba TaxID=561176 RepID=A0A1H5DQS3_9ACTN|nr:hypothetical protein [Jiangella alba]SED81197.1 hypothetical protein SAMN04488561_0488 [Jiangella alba]